jgi:hypothetical protein
MFIAFQSLRERLVQGLWARIVAFDGVGGGVLCQRMRQGVLRDIEREKQRAVRISSETSSPTVRPASAGSNGDIVKGLLSQGVTGEADVCTLGTSGSCAPALSQPPRMCTNGVCSVKPGDSVPSLGQECE